MNVKAKRLAMRQALSLAANDSKIIVIEDICVKEARRLELAKLLAKIGAKGSVLIVVDNKTDELVACAAATSAASSLSAPITSTCMT